MKPEIKKIGEVSEYIDTNGNTQPLITGWHLDYTNGADEYYSLEELKEIVANQD